MLLLYILLNAHQLWIHTNNEVINAVPCLLWIWRNLLCTWNTHESDSSTNISVVWVCSCVYKDWVTKCIRECIIHWKFETEQQQQIGVIKMLAHVYMFSISLDQWTNLHKAWHNYFRGHCVNFHRPMAFINILYKSHNHFYICRFDSSFIIIDEWTNLLETLYKHYINVSRASSLISLNTLQVRNHRKKTELAQEFMCF